jgi:hypothetical protein
MNRNVFDQLHNVLCSVLWFELHRKDVISKGIRSFFLWMCGCPQEMRQSEDRFYRSKETCSRKFDKVLRSVNKLAADIIRPLDLEFTTVHPRLQHLCNFLHTLTIA